MDKYKDLFRVGVITEPHGIQGEVKIYPTTDEPERLHTIKEILLDDGKDMMVLHPHKLKMQKQFVILKFKEFNDRNAVEGLRKKELYVTRENAVQLEKDEYYISDLIGLNVIDKNEEEIGVVTEVLPTGANDVYQIKRTDGTDLLLPAIKECILMVNVKEGYMKVHVMEGL